MPRKTDQPASSRTRGFPKISRSTRGGARPSEPVRRFHALGQHFMEESWSRFPQEASEHGLHFLDGEFGPNDAPAHLAQRQLLSDTLRGVEALPDSAFAGDDWLDRRGFLALLRTELYFNATHERWRIDPQRHCSVVADSLLHLSIRHAENLARGREAIESRLAQSPRFLAEGAAGLRRPVPLWTELAQKACGGAVVFLQELGTALAEISPDREKTGRLVRDAIAAFESYGKTIARVTPGKSDSYAIGREGFEFLVRERTGLPHSLPEVRALGADLVARLTHEVAVEARKFGRGKAGAILEAAAAQWKPQAPTLLEEYQRVTATMRERFGAAKLMTFPPNERCRVLPVPAFLRHQFPTAAYHQPGPFDRDQTGIFWVNDLSLLQRNEAKRAAEVQQHYGLELTCAHEAYPGHHLQFVVQNQHASPLRRLFHHAIFYEGWTLWVEKMCLEQAIVDFPEARLIQLNDALWRAYRIGIDCDLHDRAVSYTGAARRLQEGVGFTAARARGDVNWYTASPTVPMSYLLGRLEVERLHTRLVGGEGWSLRQFNDWMLSHGAIPWSWIWAARLHGAN